MLIVEDIHASYGRVKVLFGVDLVARPGEILCLLGRNGAGKTTILKTIMGHVPLSKGRIALDGVDIAALPAHERPKRGIGYVPQGRRLFPELSVDENIEMGLMAGDGSPDTKEWVLEIFPRLGERLSQEASTLSGGEQQMLAIARALCIRPKVLLLDEPTEGLQPSIIKLIRDVIVRMKENGLAIVLVEQRVDAVLSVADRVAFIEHGKNAETLPTEALRREQDKIRKYLGI